jgi:hypothetical protein
MADEAVFSPADAIRACGRSADLISIADEAGRDLAVEEATIAEAAGILPRSDVGIGVGSRPLHFMAATPNVRYGSDFYIPYFSCSGHRTRPSFEDGCAYVLHGPGLGVDLTRRRSGGSGRVRPDELVVAMARRRAPAELTDRVEALTRFCGSHVRGTPARPCGKRRTAS